MITIDQVEFVIQKNRFEMNIYGGSKFRILFIRDFVTPIARATRPGVSAFRVVLNAPATRAALAQLGMKI